MDDSYLVPVRQDQSQAGQGGHAGSQSERLAILRRIEQQGADVEDQGGYVRVSVDHCGRVESVWLDPRLSATPLDKLAPHIAAVCAKAFDERLAEISRIVTENADHLDPAVVDEVAAMMQRQTRR